MFYDGLMFKTTEAAFQAAKTFNLKERTKIAYAETPGQAKRMGRAVTLRPDWEEVKDKVMLDILRLKFTKGSEYARRLDDTGQAILVEGTTWHDHYWGCCSCARCKGEGRNVLGQILMQIRDENRGVTPSPFFHHEVRYDWLGGGPFNISENQRCR